MYHLFCQLFKFHHIIHTAFGYGRQIAAVSLKIKFIVSVKVSCNVDCNFHLRTLQLKYLFSQRIGQCTEFTASLVYDVDSTLREHGPVFSWIRLEGCAGHLFLIKSGGSFNQEWFGYCIKYKYYSEWWSIKERMVLLFQNLEKETYELSVPCYTVCNWENHCAQQVLQFILEFTYISIGRFSSFVCITCRIQLPQEATQRKIIYIIFEPFRIGRWLTQNCHRAHRWMIVREIC